MANKRKLKTDIPELKIKEVLKEYGLDRKYKGFSYVLYIVKYLSDNTEPNEPLKIWSAYEAAAEHFGTKPSCVEQTIRNSLRKREGYEGAEHITNKKFILSVLDESSSL